MYDGYDVTKCVIKSRRVLMSKQSSYRFFIRFYYYFFSFFGYNHRVASHHSSIFLHTKPLIYMYIYVGIACMLQVIFKNLMNCCSNDYHPFLLSHSSINIHLTMSALIAFALLVNSEALFLRFISLHRIDWWCNRSTKEREYFLCVLCWKKQVLDKSLKKAHHTARNLFYVWHCRLASKWPRKNRDMMAHTSCFFQTFFPSSSSLNFRERKKEKRSEYVSHFFFIKALYIQVTVDM